MIRILALFLVCASLVFAADIDGKWKVEAKDNEGNQHYLTMQLKTDAGKVGGMITADDGTELPLKDVVLDGNRLTFKLSVDEGDYSVKLTHSGNAMKGTYTGPAGESGTVACTR